ncbi:class I SAM-dependent methyltransferase [Nocardia sp. NPDC019395]|uniref:class I SAM-dependent methyltransferase n=1 Tax=Nocardia sp. NPDC019395 TaxID=3154686 RepID=UPI003404A6B7
MHKVRFTEEKATMLATLYGRAIDNRRENPILGDQAAEDALAQIDYDFGSLGVDPDLARSVAARAKLIDGWAAEFLSEQPAATVLHLGCGLDTRYLRLAPPATVNWYDLDYPEVIALRREIFPERDSYRMIPSPVTEPGWLDDIPAGRPGLIVAEGLTMYLQPEEGAALLRRLVAHFPSGLLICDVYSRLGVKLQKLNPVVRRSGSTLHWGVDDPAEFEQYGLRPLTDIDAGAWADRDGLGRAFADASLGLRWQLALTRRVPALRRLARIGRWAF